MKFLASPAILAAAQKRGLAAPPEPQAAPAPEPSPQLSDRHQRFSDLMRLLQTQPAFCEPVRPLAIGVHNQVRQLIGLSCTYRELSEVLGWWCSRPDYLAAVVAGAERINLDGWCELRPFLFARVLL